MTRPPSPQFVATGQGWSWKWKTPEGLPDPVTGVVVKREVELEWQEESTQLWKVRSRIAGAGWGEPRVVGADPWEEPLDAPETYEHAERLAHDYANRPKGPA